MDLPGSVSRWDLTGIPPVESQWKCSSFPPSPLTFQIYKFLNFQQKQEQINYPTLYFQGVLASSSSFECDTL